MSSPTQRIGPGRIWLDQTGRFRYNSGMNDLVSTLLNAVPESLRDLRAKIVDVKWAPPAFNEDNCISFTMNGQRRIGFLKGRNADLILTGDPEPDAAIALRTFLDGDTELVKWG
jgi:hypothetical protein